MTLLSKALKRNKPRRAYQPVNNETIELALAVLTQKISMADAAYALGHPRGGARTYVEMFRGLVAAHKQGKIKV